MILFDLCVFVMSLKQEFVKELEEKSALKASVIGSGSLILMLGEREHNIETQKNSKSSGYTENLQPSKSGNYANYPEESHPESVDVSSTAEDNLETTFSSGLSVFSAETQTRTKGSDTNVPKSSNFQENVLPTDVSSVDISATEHILSLDGVTSQDSTSEETVLSTHGLSVKQDTNLSPVLMSLQSQLSKVEQDWVEIQSNIPALQHKLHQVYLQLWKISIQVHSRYFISMSFIIL